MSKALDVYRDWLGITDTQRPLSYYQLLRLKPFEDDTARIRSHYQKMNAHVRKFATGSYAAQSQQLLNELAKAMLCLTDAARKREYDAALGRKEAGTGRRRSLEEILLAGKIIDQAQLAKARNLAQAIGLETRDALLQQRDAKPEAIMQAYAESLGLPYVELADVGVDEQLVPQVPPLLARQHSCVPVMVDQGQVLMASPNPLTPDVEEELRLRLGMPVRTLLCTVAGINELVTKYYSREAAAAAPAAKPAAPKPAAKPTAKPAAPEEESEPRSPEEQLRRRGMFAGFAFVWAVIGYYVVYSILEGVGRVGFRQFGIAALFGLIAAGTTFAVMTVKKM
jgi:hypothetical protein